jgi:uroporphyrinogen-III synthase
MFGKSAQAWLKRTPCLVISERLAQFASKSGMHNIIICGPDTIIEALNQFNKGHVYGKY